MNKIRQTALYAILFSLLTIPLTAQEQPDSPRVIGLFDVPRLVLSNSLAERQRQLDLRSSRIGIQNQVFEYFPSLDLQYNADLGDIFRSQNGQNTHRLSLSSTWQVLSAGDRWLDQKIRRLDYQDHVLEAQDASQNEINTALFLYLTCLKNKLDYESSLSNESISKVEYEYVVARKAQGRASELDILNAQAEMDNAAYNTASSSLTYQLSLLKLGWRLRVGPVELPQDPFREMKTTAPIDISSSTVSSSLSNLIAFRRQEITRQQLKTEEIKSFKQRFIPSVNAGMNMDWYNSSGVVDKKTALTSRASHSLYGTLFFSVSMPLFERNSLLNVWHGYKLLLESQELELQQTRENAEASLLEAVQNYDNELLLLPVAERKLESSRLNYESMSESYKLGVGSLLDLTQASQKFRESQESLTSLKVDLLLLRAEIGYLLGDTMKYLR